MTSRDFCYWLQGHFEIAAQDAGTHGLSDAQVKTIRNHLNLVFKHEIDPSIDGGNPVVSAGLQAIHDGSSQPIKWNETLLRC